MLIINLKFSIYILEFIKLNSKKNKWLVLINDLVFILYLNQILKSVKDGVSIFMDQSNQIYLILSLDVHIIF